MIYMLILGKEYTWYKIDKWQPDICWYPRGEMTLTKGSIWLMVFARGWSLVDIVLLQM